MATGEFGEVYNQPTVSGRGVENRQKTAVENLIERVRVAKMLLSLA
jgi:hypothetical protein